MKFWFAFLLFTLSSVTFAQAADATKSSVTALGELSHVEDNNEVQYHVVTGGLTVKRDFFGVFNSLGVTVSHMKDDSDSRIGIDNIVTHVFGAIPFEKSYAELDVMKSSTSDRSAKYGAQGAYYFSIPNTNFELGSNLKYSVYDETKDFSLNESLSYYISDLWLVYGGLGASLRDSDFFAVRGGARFTSELWKADVSLSAGKGPIDVGIIDKFKAGSIRVSHRIGRGNGYLAFGRTDGDLYDDTTITGGFSWDL